MDILLELEILISTMWRNRRESSTRAHLRRLVKILRRLRGGKS